MAQEDSRDKTTMALIRTDPITMAQTTTDQITIISIITTIILTTVATQQIFRVEIAVMRL